LPADESGYFRPAGRDAVVYGRNLKALHCVGLSSEFQGSTRLTTDYPAHAALASQPGPQAAETSPPLPLPRLRFLLDLLSPSRGIELAALPRYKPAMPLRWKILHPEKFVHIVADGAVTIEQMEEHFDAIAVENAMGYAKLFDGTNAVPVYTDEDVLRMGARLSAYTATMPSGPLAVVGKSDELMVTFRRFINISPSRRPAKFFKTEAEARAWLKLQMDQ
jgi:hypothetical protein